MLVDLYVPANKANEVARRRAGNASSRAGGVIARESACRMNEFLIQSGCFLLVELRFNKGAFKLF